MAISIVQNSGKLQVANTSGAQTFGGTLSSNFTPGNTVCVIISHYSDPSTQLINTVTVNGDNATMEVRKAHNTNSVNQIEIWSCVVPASSDKNVTITPTGGTGHYYTLGIIEISSSGSLSSLTTKTSGDGTGTSPSIVSTSALTGDLVVSGLTLADAYTTTITTPGGWTTVYNEGDSNTWEGGAGAYLIATSDGTQTSTWTAGTSVSYSACSVVFREESGAINGASIPTYSSYVTA